MLQRSERQFNGFLQRFRSSADLLPLYRDITLRNVHVLTPGEYILTGLDAQHELGLG